MKNYKLGLQVYAVREAFAEDPVATLRRIREMGYTGVEIPMGSITSANEGLTNESAEFYKKAIADAGLECYGILTSWKDVQPENIRATINYNNAIGSGFLVIGSVPENLVKTMDQVNAAIEQMKRIHETLKAEGIVTGYHNHDTDFFNVIEGKTFFEWVFDNMPEDFVMLIDTGNAHAGGFHTLDLLKKYPGRTPYLHIKGYSKEKGYLAWIGQDDYNWQEILETAIHVGGAKVFDVEFGSRADYDPFDRAADGCKVLTNLLNNMK